MKSSILQLKFIKVALVWSFLFGLVLTSCSKKDSTPPPPPADKTALQAAVTAAQALNDNSVEGTKPGQYEAGSKAALTAALTASKTVLADASATQSSVNNTTAQLLAAIDAYQGHLIKEIAAANLIGYWKMNGNANDSSGNGNDGVLTAGHAYYGAGMPVLTADRFGRASMAYHFDNGGNIEVPYKASLNSGEMSISVWFKKSLRDPLRTLNTDTYTMVAMNRWNGYKLQLQSANKIFFTVRHVNPGADPYYNRDDETFVADNDVWYNGIVTFKAGEMNFYVNGDLVKSWTDVPESAVTLTDPINFVIGQDLPTDKYLTVDGDFQVAWGGFWTGDLDDVMYYNVALSATQVHSIFINQNTL